MRPSQHPSLPTLSITPWTRYALAVTLCFMAASCSLCERVADKKDAARSAEDFAALLPADVDMAFFAGSFKDLRDAANILDRKVGQTIPVKAGVAEINQQYGLDLTNVKAIADKGVAVDRGLGLAIIEDQTVILVPMEAGPGFTRFLTQLAKERHGADERGVTRELVGPNQEKLVMNALVKKGADEQAAPTLTDDNLVFAWIVRDGTALVYPGPVASQNKKPAEELLKKFAFVNEQTSLAGHKDFGKLKSSMGKEYSVFGVINAPNMLRRRTEELANLSHAKEEADTYRQLAAELGLLGLGIKVDDTSARANLHILTTPETAQRIQKVARSRGDFPEFARVVDKSPALTLKLAVDFEVALKELRTVLGNDSREGLDQNLRLLKGLIGVDIKDALLPALDGNVMVNVYEATPLALAALSQERFLDFIDGSRATISFGIKDRQKLIASLDGAAKTFPALVTRQDEGNTIVYVLRREKAAELPSADDNPFKLKLDSFDPNANGGQADADAGQADADAGQGDAGGAQPEVKPQPEGEVVAHLVVTDRVAMLLTRMMPRQQGVSLAMMSGQGPEGALAHPRTAEVLAASDASAITIDVKALLELLGPQAFAVGGAFRSFSVWQLDVRPVADGAKVQLELVFADQSKTEQEPTGQDAGATPQEEKKN